MGSQKHEEWEQPAFRSAVSTALFVLVPLLIVAAVRWFFFGKVFDKGEGDAAFGLLLLVFSQSYFSQAISSIHKRLDELEETTRRKNV
jgi:Na+/phosphate symporter